MENTDTNKIQALFLVDIAKPRSDTVDLNQQFRAICLACTRILLYLSQFPNKEHLKSVQWNYKLFTSQPQTSIKLRPSSTQFQDVSSHNLENFFNQLEKVMNHSQPDEPKRTIDSMLPIQLLYNALAASVQDFVWDAPEIVSPVRRLSSQQQTKSRSRTQSTKEFMQKRNCIFICGTCPESERELVQFCGVNKSVSNVKKYVQKKLLPPPLFAQLEGKAIALHWVHVCNTGAFSEQSTPALSLMSAILSQTKGTLIPSMSLIGPTHTAFKQVGDVSNTSSENTDIASSVSDTKSEVHNTVDLMDIHVSSGDVNGRNGEYSMTITSQPDFSSEIHSEEKKACPSNVQSVPQKDTIKKNSKTKKTTSNDVLSALALPSLSCLDRYLQGQRLNRYPAKLVTAGEQGFYWLCTTAGKILYVLELNSMYNKSLRSPPSCPPGPITHHLPTNSLPEEKRTTMKHYSLTASQALDKGKTKTKKKLDFSAIDKKCVPETRCSDVNHSGLPGYTSQASHTGECSRTVQSSQVALSCLRDQPSSKNKAKDDYTPSDPSSPQSTPHIVVVGVVKQSDVPLSSLCPTSSCSCSGLYVQRQTRHKHIQTHFHKHTSDVPHTSDYQLSSVRSTTPPSTTNTNLICKTPEMTTSGPLNTTKSPSLFSHSPKIHLIKHPFTPPSQSTFKRALCSLRKRSKSAPLFSNVLNSHITACLEKSVTVDVHRCVSTQGHLFHSPRHRSKGQRLQRSVSMSPRYPVLKLKSVLGYHLGSKVPHPKDCLSQTSRFHSKQFQGLCVWLAQNKLFLVTSVCCQSGSTSLAILQPITSLVASLTVVQSHYQNTLLSKLTKLPSTNVNDKQLVSFVTQPSTSEHVSSKSHRDEKAVLTTHILSRGSDTPAGKGSEVGSRFACDAELMLNLSLLFKQSSQVSGDQGNITFLRDSITNLPSFSHQSLLPWFTFADRSGVNKTTFEGLQQIHSDCSSSHSANSKLSLMDKLRSLYGNKDTAVLGSTIDHHASVNGGGLEEQRIPQDNKAGGAVGNPAENVTKESDQEVPMVTTFDQLREWFKTSYKEQIEATEDQELKSDSMQRWASATVSKFSKSFVNIITSIDKSSNHRAPLALQNELWQELNLSVLINGGALGQKYEALFKGLQNSGGNKEGEEHEGNKEKEKEESCASQRLSEYLLQVFLRLEALKVCPESCEDIATFADQLIFLLRKISLMANPGLLGNLMKKVVLPLYVDSCKAVLLHVYEGLMLPLPPDLDPDPDSETESPDVSQGEDQGSSDEESSLLSMEEPLCAPKLPQLGIRKLARHTSFQEVSSQRQISIVNKKKKKKKNKTKKTEKSTMHKLKLRTKASMPLRRSPRIAKQSAEDDPEKGRTGVCRSLFSRSHSVCEGVTSLKRKRTGDSDSQEARATKRKKSGMQRYSTMVPDILVKETPVKKQVENYHTFKLQRLRSKSSIMISPDVIAIEESPRRSFYSKPRITRMPDSETPHFKTPPIKQKTMSPARLLLKKEPSPAALHSLLHGEILSPLRIEGSKDTCASGVRKISSNFSRSAVAESPLQINTTGTACESPEMFDAMSESPAISSQTVNVIGRTPSKKLGGFSTPKHSSEVTSNVTFTDVSGVGMSKNKTVNFRTARMLTYDNENPIQCEMVKCHEMNGTPTSTVHTTNHPLPSHQSDVTILDIPGLYAPLAKDEPNREEVMLISPPDLDKDSTCLGDGCFLTGIDPSIENESASMIAFALSTPTKDDRKDFHGAFLNSPRF